MKFIQKKSHLFLWEQWVSGVIHSSATVLSVPIRWVHVHDLWGQKPAANTFPVQSLFDFGVHPIGVQYQCAFRARMEMDGLGT